MYDILSGGELVQVEFYGGIVAPVQQTHTSSGGTHVQLINNSRHELQHFRETFVPYTSTSVKQENYILHPVASCDGKMITHQLCANGFPKVTFYW